jgi:uncharacterized protein YcbK (DUF882 family)
MLIGQLTCRCDYPDCPGGALSLKLCIAINELEELLPRDYVIYVNSGFRCYKHNKDSGGSTNSYHMLGLAIDLYCKDLDVLSLLEVALEIDAFRRGGIGVYLNENKGKEFLHLDVRDYKSRWFVQNGVLTPWEF